MAIHGFDVPRFLRDYWQTKSLLIRQGLPGFACPVSGDDLAGLACEREVESRLIVEQANNWQLRQGPFKARDFTKLPATGWTLLVQRVDHWIPEVTELIAHVDFLPRWRIDDIMISYAVQGGGVGPHFDNYDVFLLQGSGRREWRLGQQCDENTVLRPATDLKLLADFTQSECHILNPGDILYVPPGTAHWGTALDNDCITLSIGFRAPASAEILGRWTDDILGQLGESERYRDLPATLAQGNGLSAAHIEALRELLLAKLDDDSLIKSFGELVTEATDPQPVSGDGATDVNGCVSIAPDARLTYFDGAPVRLFANGSSMVCDAAALPVLKLLCDLLPGEMLPEALWFTVSGQLPEIAEFLLSTGAVCSDPDGSDV